MADTHERRVEGVQGRVRLSPVSRNAAIQRRADARNPEHIYGRCALAAFAC
jgi:hypothetical protein